MPGLTIKQYHQERFWQLLKAYKEALPNATKTEEERIHFIHLSIALHAQLGHVPKYYKKYVRQAYKGA
jgi:hypothetical protein